MMSGVPIARVSARSYRFPSDTPEADGTADWDSTTMVLVEIEAGGEVGIGYSYAASAAASVVNDLLRKVLTGRDAFAIHALWATMADAVLNIGRRGVSACAISAA